MKFCFPPGNSICEAASSHSLHDKRVLVSVDGLAASALRGEWESVTCEDLFLSWYDGCNGNVAGITVGAKGDAKRSNGGSTTLMTCGAPPNVQGLREFQAALGGLSRWRLDERDMLIFEGGGHELVFAREK